MDSKHLFVSLQGLERQEKMLAILLRCIAAMLLLAVFPVFFPYAWMDAIHRAMGMGALPGEPIVGYLSRSLSAFYAMHGALYWFLSNDVRRYRAAIRFLAILGLIFGVWIAAMDWAEGMPLMWTCCEGPIVLALSALVFVYSRED
ncbi:hypothetical protein JXA32_02915 [Candidatus Sumerlaeota bacterium]|nr:hypothetical protein [Candidatus Sumerlaeota bacterium]